MTHQKTLLIAAGKNMNLKCLADPPKGFRVLRSTGLIPSIELAKTRRIDVIVAVYPLSPEPFQVFVDEIRSCSSRSRGTGLVVVTDRGGADEVAGLVGNGVNRLLEHDQMKDLHHAVNSVINVSPRVNARLFVRLTVVRGERNCNIRTYSENISNSGMLLGTSTELEIGTQFDFGFVVPNNNGAVAGRGEVVRHARKQRGRNSGIGIRFVGLSQESRKNLGTFLETVLT